MFGPRKVGAGDGPAALLVHGVARLALRICGAESYAFIALLDAEVSTVLLGMSTKATHRAAIRAGPRSLLAGIRAAALRPPGRAAVGTALRDLHALHRQGDVSFSALSSIHAFSLTHLAECCGELHACGAVDAGRRTFPADVAAALRPRQRRLACVLRLCRRRRPRFFHGLCRLRCLRGRLRRLLLCWLRRLLICDAEPARVIFASTR